MTVKNEYFQIQIHVLIKLIMYKGYIFFVFYNVLLITEKLLYFSLS